MKKSSEQVLCAPLTTAAPGVGGCDEIPSEKKYKMLLRKVCRRKCTQGSKLKSERYIRITVNCTPYLRAHLLGSWSVAQKPATLPLWGRRPGRVHGSTRQTVVFIVGGWAVRLITGSLGPNS